MMNKTNDSMSKRQGVWAACLLAFAFMLTQPDKALAQCSCPWVPNGNNISYNSGNVGIGTSNPSRLFHILDNSNSPVFAGARISTILTASDPVMEFLHQSSNIGFRWRLGSGGGRFFLDYSTSGFSQFAPYMTVLNTGNVGIGTTNPISALHVVSTLNSQPRGLVVEQNSDDAESSTIFLRKSRGTTASPASVMNLDGLGFISVDAFDGTDYRDAGRIRFSVDGPVTTGSVPSSIQFQTNGSIERMRITSAGNVGIGTNNPGSLLHLAGPSGVAAITFNTPGNQRFRLQTLPGVANWGGLTINSNYTFPTGWVLDDTSTNGWFLKLETRGTNGANSNNGLWLWRIPPGSNPHTDEIPVFGITNGQAYFAGNVGIGTNTPATKLHVSGEILSAGPTAAHSFLDRTSGRAWAWYGAGDVARFWNNSFGDLIGITASGNVGVGTTAPSSKLHVVGDVTLTGTGSLSASGTITAGNIIARYQDIAEWVPARHTMPAGTVVVLDTDKSNQVVASQQAYDTRVAGVVSESPGVILGEGGQGKVMVATTGRVRVMVDATRAPIRVGDILVTSDREGIAMRSEPIDIGGAKLHRPGTIIGKALEPLDKGVGHILVLLSLQ